MGQTWRVIWAMGYVQRLAPFSIATALAMALFWTPWLLLALAYGALAQGFVEYALHRFIYHRPPPAKQSAFNALYRSHIGHHEFPNDPTFFTGDDPWFPLRIAGPSVAAHTLVLWPFLGFGPAALAASVAIFLGSAATFIFYEYCHTLAHLRVPKGWFGRKVTQTHLRHHFNDPNSTFHVTPGMGWIDHLFGTAYDRDRAHDRFDPDTILSLGLDPEDLRLIAARKAYGVTSRPRARTRERPG